MDDEKLIFCGNDKEYLSESLTKYSDESNGAAAFRIPSIIKSGNTLIAAINAQENGDDWGYIGIAVRTSDDGGESWSDIKFIARPPARKTKSYAKSYSCAFFINPCLSVAKNGDVILTAEFYPECKSPDNKTITDKKKIPYSMYNKKMYPLIYDRDGKFYLVGENGVVLDSKYNETDYRVTDWRGSLFKGDDYVGNIYLNGQWGEGDENSVTTFGAPLKSPKRNYVFMFRSTDNGKTWSDPVDVTMQFLMKDDGTSICVSSGNGLLASDGRTLMPLYVKDKESISIYSVDDGYDWHRMTQQPYACNSGEWQLAEAPDGIILGLGTQEKYGPTPLSISHDKGKHWVKGKPTDLYSPKCQKSVIAIGDNVLCSHPSGKNRSNGVITIGKFKKAKGQTVGIKWKNEIEVNRGFFGYSCLVQIDDEYLGILYESAPSSYILFKKYKISELI